MGARRRKAMRKVAGIVDDIKDTLKVMPRDHDKASEEEGGREGRGMGGRDDPITADDLAR
eukprot:704804-Hanusia_phi.AAC.2